MIVTRRGSIPQRQRLKLERHEGSQRASEEGQVKRQSAKGKAQKEKPKNHLRALEFLPSL